MARADRPLPNIPVKHAQIRKVLNVTAPLEAKLRAYIAYYTAQQSLDPRQAPSESDTIVAIVEDFRQRDRVFGRYLRNEAGQKRGIVDESQTVGMKT
ncbi:MAG: hypothetical protein IJI03_18855 [Rudaea sp.]|nr:hypothetical protein [Rudaea sp.]